MKLFIIGPPKSGANRLRCLLATAFALRARDARDAPDIAEPDIVVDWLETLPDNIVTHSDLPFDPALPVAAADLGLTFISIIRHPFDLYVSNREVRSNRAQRVNRRAQKNDSSTNVHATSPDPGRHDALGTFAGDLQSLLDWTTGAAVTLRYEDILEHPDSALAAVSQVIMPLDAAQIQHAVRLCPSEQRIVSSGNRGVRMAEIAPGAWRTEIDQATLDSLQSQFAPSVISLGYEPALTP